MFLCNCGSKPIWTALAKVDPALFNPNGMQIKQYVPHGVMNDVFSSSSLDMKIWWYPEYASRKESKTQPEVESTIWSIRDKGNGSFGQALLRSVKSMQRLHFPLAFWTTTGFANHVGCSTPLTKPVASSFLISSAMNCCLSKACFRTFCLTGRACGQTTRWCSISSLGTPGISDGCQENTSIFARRKTTSALSYLSSRVALMVKVPSMPASPVGTFFTCGVATLDLLLLEHSGTSSMGAVHSERSCFSDSLPESLQPCFFPLSSLPETTA